MSEDTRRLVGPNVEQRYLALAQDGALRCPICDHSTPLTSAGRVSLRVFDRFRGHLLGHDIIEFLEVRRHRARFEIRGDGRSVMYDVEGNVVFDSRAAGR